MKLFMVFSVLLVLPLAAGTAQDAVPTVKLDQAISEALANGDGNKILKGNLDAARAQYALNVSKDSFTLSGSLGYTKGHSFGDTTILADQTLPSSGVAAFPEGPQAGIGVAGPLTGVTLNAYPVLPITGASGNSSAFTLALNQTLWNGYPGGPSKAAVDKSLLTLQGQELTAESGRLALVYGVKQAYYAMLSAQQSLVSQKQTLAQQNAVLAQIQATYDLKLSSLVDLKTAQLNAGNAQVNVDTAENNMRSARYSLAVLMGRPVDSRFQVEATGEPALPVDSLEKAVSEGLSRRTDVKQIQLNVKSGNIDIAVAQGQATPTVSVSGGVSVLYDWTGSDTGELSANVKISMPVLDAGAVKNQVDALRSQNTVYSAQEDQTVKNITTGISNAWYGIQIAKEKLDYANLAADTTQLQLKIVEAQQKNGTASTQDLLTAAVNAANAQTALQAATSAYQLGVLALENAMGY
jgi:outer membrane protein TolC